MKWTVTVCCMTAAHYSGELAGWIEKRLEQLREMAAEANESSSDEDVEEEMEEDEDTPTQCELLILLSHGLAAGLLLFGWRCGVVVGGVG